MNQFVILQETRRLRSGLGSGAAEGSGLGGTDLNRAML
jgi:hypothetical protein